VLHVEAGLRTRDLSAPFPEEANRQLIGRIASFHFAPTDAAARALASEAISRDRIEVVGNTAIDALLLVQRHLKGTSRRRSFRANAEILSFIAGRKLVLVTAHRRESFGKPFEDICCAIKELGRRLPAVRVVYPVHPNPHVQEVVHKELAHQEHVLLVAPLDYVAFVDLMTRAAVLLTDSGGIQEEAPSLRIPVLVMRNTTERPEGVRAGFSKLVGTDPTKIVESVADALKRGCRGRGPNPYGDGKAAERIMCRVELLATKTLEGRASQLTN
jgi:UDP-N-acetylglucosamine 2-epimerase (non-hydrolysing)